MEDQQESVAVMGTVVGHLFVRLEQMVNGCWKVQLAGDQDDVMQKKATPYLQECQIFRGSKIFNHGSAVASFVLKTPTATIGWDKFLSDLSPIIGYACH